MEFFYWLGRQFSSEGAAQYTAWYSALEKPFFAPPSFVFGFAWGVIYPLIGIALLWTLYVWASKKVSLSFVFLFLLNIALNLSFSATLLASRNNILISLHILSVLVTLLWLELLAWKRSQIIFWLLVPYVLWGTFATVLQLTITVLN